MVWLGIDHGCLMLGKSVFQPNVGLVPNSAEVFIVGINAISLLFFVSKFHSCCEDIATYINFVLVVGYCDTRGHLNGH